MERKDLHIHIEGHECTWWRSEQWVVMVTRRGRQDGDGGDGREDIATDTVWHMMIEDRQTAVPLKLAESREKRPQQPMSQKSS